MKKIILSMYISTFILSILFLSSLVFDFRYDAWEEIITMREIFWIYLLVCLLPISLVVVSFMQISKKNKKEMYKQILGSISVLYICLIVVLYPFIRIFVGTKLLILLVSFSLMPLTIVSSKIIYIQTKLIYKRRK